MSTTTYPHLMHLQEVDIGVAPGVPLIVNLEEPSPHL